MAESMKLQFDPSCVLPDAHAVRVTVDKAGLIGVGRIGSRPRKASPLDITAVTALSEGVG